MVQNYSGASMTPFSSSRMGVFELYTTCATCNVLYTFMYPFYSAFITFFLLATNPTPSPDASLPQRGTQITTWAIFLGVSSSLLAAMQYAPQILHTYRLKLVGALSIKMMLIQSPGALFMVLSIALRLAGTSSSFQFLSYTCCRPGTNWTSMLLSSQ